MASADAGAEIGDGGTGCKTTLLQLEQADGPGVGVAVFFQAEQTAVAGSNIGAHQHGSAALEDFIKGGHVDVGQMVLEVIGAGLVDGSVHDVVHRAHRQVHAQEIAAKFDDATIGTVADQGQAQGGLPQPRFGHR
jgi:hypothetical protein